MLQIRKSDDRGTGRLDWLDARFTFSFGPYKDPEQTGFSDLLLLNDDRVKGGGGFATHEHADTEVFSYVLEGALAHKDSMGEGSTVVAGEVLMMSAGSGITHSEFNGSATAPVRFIQVWVQPTEKGGTPRYGQRAFPETVKRGRLCPILSPDGRERSLTWRADATVYAGLLDGQESAELRLGTDRFAFVHTVRGSLDVNGVRLTEGDGARVRHEDLLRLTGGDNAEVLVFDLRPFELPTDATAA